MKWSFRTSGNYVEFVHTDETDLHIESIIKHLHNTSRCIDWSLPSDTTRITFTIDESKYENVKVTDIDFDGSVMDSQDDFETGITAMFTGLAGGTSSSYSVYTAKLTQTGTSVPFVTVLENTLGGTVVWTRQNAGEYRGTLAGAFPFAKTHIASHGAWEGAATTFLPISDGAAILGYYSLSIDFVGSNYILLYVVNTSFAAVDLSTLSEGTFYLPDVKVYP